MRLMYYGCIRCWKSWLGYLWFWTCYQSRRCCGTLPVWPCVRGGMFSLVQVSKAAFRITCDHILKKKSWKNWTPRPVKLILVWIASLDVSTMAEWHMWAWTKKRCLVYVYTFVYIYMCVCVWSIAHHFHIYIYSFTHTFWYLHNIYIYIYMKHSNVAEWVVTQ